MIILYGHILKPKPHPPLLFPTHRLPEEEGACLTLPRARDTDRKSEERRQVWAG